MISVIIPTLNEAKLLPRMFQQFSPEIIRKFNLEIVVSDGGSTDGTLEIAHGFAHVVVENTSGRKQTISIGRNEGARRASGDLLVFLNADTLVRDVDAFFATMAEEIENPGVVALTCTVSVYPEEERTADRIFHGFYNWFFSMMNRVGMAMGRGECHVMKRETFARVAGYADRIAAGEDYDMFRRLHTLGRIAFLRRLRVYESPRRYRRDGYLFVSASWFMNFLAVFLFHRSILSEWKPVR